MHTHIYAEFTGLAGDYGYACIVLKGTEGVSTNGVTANCMFLDRDTFWVLPLTYFYIRNLLGWPETRLAQRILNYLNLAQASLRYIEPA